MEVGKDSAAVADVRELIAYLRETYPDPGNCGVLPQNRIRDVWALLLKVPGVSAPPIPELPPCDLVTMLKCDNSHNGEVWQAFQNALIVAEQALGEAPPTLDGFVPAKEIITKHSPEGVVLNYRKLNKFLELHPKIRTHKPSKNRRNVNLADWHEHRQALIEWYGGGVEWYDGDDDDGDGDSFCPSPDELEERKAAVRYGASRGK